MAPGTENSSSTRRPRVGDLVEIRTRGGLGYVQYAARDKALGPQLRVLPGTFEVRPDLRELAVRRALYYVHFPLGAAVSRRLVAVVGNEPLPTSGTSVRAEDELFRLQEIWNDTMLAERIADGWRPV